MKEWVCFIRLLCFCHFLGHQKLRKSEGMRPVLLCYGRACALFDWNTVVICYKKEEEPGCGRVN